MAKIGFIGLGIMGTPMAANLIQGGHSLSTYTRSKTPQSLLDAGAKALPSATEVARAADIIEMYGPERLMVNSAGDWGPSKPTAVPDFIFEMRRRGHSEGLIRRVVYENPLTFFSQSKNFQFTPREDSIVSVG